jgi:hypothetical protein
MNDISFWWFGVYRDKYFMNIYKISLFSHVFNSCNTVKTILMSKEEIRFVYSKVVLKYQKIIQRHHSKY